MAAALAALGRRLRALGRGGRGGQTPSRGLASPARYEESRAEFAFVERLLPPSCVPEPPAHPAYPTPSGWSPPAGPPPGSPLFRAPLPLPQPAGVRGPAAGPAPHGSAPHPRRPLGAGAGPEGVPGLAGGARGGGAGERGERDPAAPGPLGAAGAALAAPERLLKSPEKGGTPPNLLGGTPGSARDRLRVQPERAAAAAGSPESTGERGAHPGHPKICLGHLKIHLGHPKICLGHLKIHLGHPNICLGQPEIHGGAWGAPGAAQHLFGAA